MSQAPSQDHINAMRVAEWKAEAALKGKTFAQVATESMTGRYVGKSASFCPGECWFGLSEQVRGFLLAIATDRATSSNRIRWDQLTDREKLDVGVMARLLVRELKPVAGCLR